MRAPWLLVALPLACGAYGRTDDAPGDVAPDGGGMQANEAGAAEAGGADAGGEGDATPPPVEGGAPPSCPVTFCSDFEADPPLFGWTQLDGSPLPSVGDGWMGSQALRINAPTADTPQSYLRFYPDDPPTTLLELAFELRVRALPTAQDAVPITIAQLHCAGTNFVSLKLRPDGTLQLQSSVSSSQAHFAEDTWTAVTLRWEFASKAVTLSVNVDVAQIETPDVSTCVNAAVELGVVAFNYPHGAPYDALVDDVRVDSR